VKRVDPTKLGRDEGRKVTIVIHDAHPVSPSSPSLRATESRNFDLLLHSFMNCGALVHKFAAGSCQVICGNG
jgi:hypothetical protein